MNEPEITVNGQELTFAQAMAVRVALSNFALELSEPNALGNDPHGISMRIAYRARIDEIMQLIMGVP